MFRINEVLQYEQTLYRILMLFEYYVLWIKVHDDKAFPQLIEIAELEQGFQDEILKRVDDPYSDLITVTPEYGSTAQIKRDENYEVIKPLVIKQRLVAKSSIKLLLRQEKRNKQYIVLLEGIGSVARSLMLFYQTIKIQEVKAKSVEQRLKS